MGGLGQSKHKTVKQTIQNDMIIETKCVLAKNQNINA